MIGLLRGIVMAVDTDKLILEVSGIGYIVNTSARTLSGLKEGDEKTLYTHLIVREDDLILYGFNNIEDKELFTLLLSVSGIGPKAAAGILSIFSVNQVVTAIMKEDSTMLTEVPGIGAKTAKRVILELKEKVKDKADIYTQTSPDSERGTVDTNMFSRQADEALETLLALGFNRMEAREALRIVDENSELTVEERIKQALRYMASSKEKR